MDVAVGGGVVRQRIVDPPRKDDLPAQAKAGNVAPPRIDVFAADNHQTHFPPLGLQSAHRPQKRGHALEAEIVGYDQRHHRVGRQAQMAPRRFALGPADFGRKSLGIDAIVNDPDPLRGHAVKSLEIGGRSLRQGQHDLPVVGVLPLHERVKRAMPRQHPVGYPLQPAEPCRQK